MSLWRVDQSFYVGETYAKTKENNDDAHGFNDDRSGNEPGSG
jgi:hypothetical protein